MKSKWKAISFVWTAFKIAMQSCFVLMASVSTLSAEVPELCFVAVVIDDMIVAGRQLSYFDVMLSDKSWKENLINEAIAASSIAIQIFDDSKIGVDSKGYFFPGVAYLVGQTYYCQVNDLRFTLVNHEGVSYCQFEQDYLMQVFLDAKPSYEKSGDFPTHEGNYISDEGFSLTAGEVSEDFALFELNLPCKDGNERSYTLSIFGGDVLWLASEPVSMAVDHRPYAIKRCLDRLLTPQTEHLTLELRPAENGACTLLNPGFGTRLYVAIDEYQAAFFTIDLVEHVNDKSVSYSITPNDKLQVFDELIRYSDTVKLRNGAMKKQETVNWYKVAGYTMAVVTLSAFSFYFGRYTFVRAHRNQVNELESKPIR